MKKSDIRWFKENFGAQIETRFAGSGFTLDLLTAMAMQETGYIWARLRKTMDVAEVLKLCVGDTIDAKANGRGRRAFPKNKAELVRKNNGDQMFAIARKALVDVAKHVKSYRPSAAKKRKFCRGYGIFQYDLQFFLNDPDYFLNYQWHDFDRVLDVVEKELDTALKQVQRKGGIPRNSTGPYSDKQLAYIGIAYNTGRYKPSRGLRQGYKPPGGRYYGENLYDFIKLSRSVSWNSTGNPTGNGGSNSPLPVGAYKVIARDGLNLREGPGTNFPVRKLLPHGTVVYVLKDSGLDWVLVDLKNDGQADGHVHRSYIRREG